MSGFNGAGVFSISGTGQPYVTGTVISSSVVNQLNTDIATGLSTCILKDGTQTATAVVPFASGISLSGGTTLSAYSVGTWTPSDGSGAGLVLSSVADCNYIKIGRLVVITFAFTYPITADGTNAKIAGLPATSLNSTNDIGGGPPALTTFGAYLSLRTNLNATTMQPYNAAGTALTNANISGVAFRGTIIYMSNS